MTEGVNLSSNTSGVQGGFSFSLSVFSSANYWRAKMLHLTYPWCLVKINSLFTTVQLENGLVSKADLSIKLNNVYKMPGK